MEFDAARERFESHLASLKAFAEAKAGRVDFIRKNMSVQLRYVDIVLGLGLASLTILQSCKW
jgi:hypothetical protein